MGRGKGFLFCLRDIPVPNFLFVNCLSSEFLSKSSYRGGSKILVHSWVSSSEKGLDNSSKQEWVANPLEKGNFDFPGCYLRKSIRKIWNNPSEWEWVVNSSEKGIKKKQWISLEVSPMSSQ